MLLTVTAHSKGKKLHRLEIYADGHFIGEYERAQLDDIGRKKIEVQNAAEVLVRIHNKYGE